MQIIAVILWTLLLWSVATAQTILVNPQTNASNLITGTLAAARGGAGTVNGALKGNGSGAVSQAACADLSNGATGCSTAVGTSGATIPLLSTANTWSANLQTVTAAANATGLLVVGSGNTAPGIQGVMQNLTASGAQVAGLGFQVSTTGEALGIVPKAAILFTRNQGNGRGDLSITVSNNSNGTSPAGTADAGITISSSLSKTTISGGGGVSITQGPIVNAAITADTALTDTTVCQDTTNHQFYYGTGALGICLGTSGRQFKTAFAPMAAGIDDLMKINFQNYRYLNGYGDNGDRLQYGATAQDIEAALPDLARHNAKGETINYDSGALLFIGLRAIQQLKTSNDNLKAEIELLKQIRR